MSSGGRVKFTPSSGSPLTLLVANPPERGGGVGGWQSSDRAQRRPGKWFRAPTDDTYSWDLIIDLDAVGGPSVERRIEVLRLMGQPPARGEEPPTITLSGDVWEPDQAVRWVMDDMTLGERLWTEDGDLRRQHVTVALSRYVEISEIDEVRISRTRTGRKRRRRTVQSHANDTLRTIALRELGDGGRWKDLRTWNKKLAHTNPDARLRAGTHVVIR